LAQECNNRFPHRLPTLHLLRCAFAMQPATTVPLQQQLPAQAFYGLQIQDQRLATLTKRVLTMAIVSAMFTIIGNVASFLMNPQKSGITAASAIFGSGLGLLVPLCGYLGAKKSDPNLTCCFCGCNLVGSIFMLISAVSVVAAYGTFKYLIDNCEPNNPSRPQGCLGPAEWRSECSALGQPDLTPQECWKYIEDTTGGAALAVVIVQVVICIPAFTLNCLNFCFGKKLYDALKDGQVLHTAPHAPLMVTVPVQPVQQNRF